MAVVVTKRKGFSSVLTFSKNNQHRTLHLDPQQAGFIVNRNRISVIVVGTFRNTHISGTYFFQMESGESIDLR